MQEVFSKIIELLTQKENEAVLKAPNTGDIANAEYQKWMMKSYGFKESIEIVKQTAEECKTGHFGCNSNGQHEKCSSCCDYDCKNRNREWFGAKDDNNGWISCSERFPEKYNRVLAYTDAGGYYIAHVNGCGKFVCTAECVSTVIENSDVIAWQPLPAPYNPHICTNDDCVFNEGQDCPAAEGCGGYERKRTNFDMCCESMETMAQIIDIAKIGWTKEQIIEWLKKEECEVPE